MGKTGWLFSVLTINLFTVIIVQLVSSGVFTIGVTTPAVPNADVFAVAGMLLDFIVTYFKLLFFQVPGIPALFSVFFIVTNGIMFYVIVK